MQHSHSNTFAFTNRTENLRNITWKQLMTFTLRVHSGDMYRVLTFKSVDKMLWFDHSNRTFLAIVPFVFQHFTKYNLEFFF